MKQKSTLFLKLVIVLIGIATLALVTTFTVAVVRDGGGMFIPILVIMYATAIPFFIALVQALKLLGYIDKNTAFSPLSVKALKKIKYCAISIGVLYAAGLPFLFDVAEKDDAPGVVGFGLIFIFFSIVIAAFAAVLQKLLQNAIDLKAENDLTV